VKRVEKRLARLERRRPPASSQADNELRWISIRDLTRCFMMREARLEYRVLLIIVRDHF
jgi:hypothetical protein